MADVSLTGVTKVYDDAQGTNVAVEDFSLEIDDGEFVVLVGPSGCGKSTTLRMLAGLESVTDGTIRIGDEEVQMLNASARDVAMVFQNYALYPSMTARENIAYGLKHSTSLSAAERDEKVEEIAELMDIEETLESLPSEISGGQKQRVALGRALVREPDIFLLDEPLSNLDAKLRSHMRRELQRIHEEIGITTVYVTHDQTEAMTMADRIVVMNDGAIQQVGGAEELYANPVNEFVARFIGSPSMNVARVAVEEAGGEVACRLAGGTLVRLEPGQLPGGVGREVRVGLRPEDVELDVTPDGTGVPAEVLVTEYQGNEHFVHLSVGDREIVARTSRDLDVSRGDEVAVSVAPANLYVFDPDSGEALKTRAEPTADGRTPMQGE